MENQVNTKWVLDPTHSELTFKVKHLMITNVKGEFREFNAEVTTTGDSFNASSIKLTAATASVFTNNTDRDAHLRSGDFFDAEKYPELSFEGKSLEHVSDDTFVLKGALTIKGVSHDVALDVEFGGINKDPWGNQKAGFSLSGKINRKDWGLNWNAALETGGVLVSDEVKINAEVQFVKQA